MLHRSKKVSKSSTAVAETETEEQRRIKEVSV